jgi:hypothetical protein
MENPNHYTKREAAQVLGIEKLVLDKLMDVDLGT